MTRALPAKDSTEDLEDPNSFDFYFIRSSIRVPTLCECKTALAWGIQWFRFGVRFGRLRNAYIDSDSSSFVEKEC